MVQTSGDPHCLCLFSFLTLSRRFIHEYLITERIIQQGDIVLNCLVTGLHPLEASTNSTLCCCKTLEFLRISRVVEVDFSPCTSNTTNMISQLLIHITRRVEEYRPLKMIVWIELSTKVFENLFQGKRKGLWEEPLIKWFCWDSP